MVCGWLIKPEHTEQAEPRNKRQPAAFTRSGVPEVPQLAKASACLVPTHTVFPPSLFSFRRADRYFFILRLTAFFSAADIFFRRPRRLTAVRASVVSVARGRPRRARPIPGNVRSISATSASRSASGLVHQSWRGPSNQWACTHISANSLTARERARAAADSFACR